MDFEDSNCDSWSNINSDVGDKISIDDTAFAVRSGVPTDSNPTRTSVTSVPVVRSTAPSFITSCWTERQLMNSGLPTEEVGIVRDMTACSSDRPSPRLCEFCKLPADVPYAWCKFCDEAEVDHHIIRVSPVVRLHGDGGEG